MVNVAPWLGAMMVVFELVNIVGHCGLFQLRHRGYNPGLIAATFLFIPYVVIFFWLSINKNFLSPAEYVMSVIGGIVLALSLPVCAELRIKKFKERL